MSVLNTNSTVAEWVREFPQASRVFEELQIDYCCGGSVALSEACEKMQLDAEAIVNRLTQAVVHPQDESNANLGNAKLEYLCDHIEATHHAYLREELPRLTNLVEKVYSVHGEKHAELQELREVFAALRAELEPHMFKEEQILFPAIRRMEQAATQLSFPFGSVSNPIRMMEHEHDTAGGALTQIRKLTNNFVPPEDACHSFHELFSSLHKLERNMHQHIHKENNILFPRAQELEASLGGSTSTPTPMTIVEPHN